MKETKELCEGCGSEDVVVHVNGLPVCEYCKNYDEQESAPQMKKEKRFLQDWESIANPVGLETRDEWIARGILYLKEHPKENKYKTFSGDSLILVERNGELFMVWDCKIRRYSSDVE